MRERAEALGGSFVLEQRPEGGARLCLRVPDAAPAREQEEAT
jgi:signal transduction histidine kinase